MLKLYKLNFFGFYLLISFILISLCESFPQNIYPYTYPYKDGIPFERFKERRQKIIKSMNQNSALLVFSSDFTDCKQFLSGYHQSSDMYYLTGNVDSKSILLLTFTPVEIDGIPVNEIYFVKNQDSNSVKWTGLKLSSNDAEKILKIEKSFDLSRFESISSKALNNCDTLFVLLPNPSDHGGISGPPADAQLQEIRKLSDILPNLTIIYSFNDIKKLREIKDADEIRLMKKAIELSGKGIIKAMEAAKSGMFEYQLQSIFEYVTKYGGCTGNAFEPIVGSGLTTCFMHYSRNNKKIDAGDMVIMDCGAGYGGYNADLTRTFPVSGKFTYAQKIIYNIVLEAHDSAVADCMQGNPFMKPHLTAMRVIKKRLSELGLLKDEADYKRYFPHGTSHYLGLETHDVGTYSELKPGVVITIEPGIYIPQGSPCDSKWWNIGVRIEDDVLITGGKPEILSESPPKTIKEIEKIIGKK